MGAAQDESADVVDDVESVVRDSANGTGCSSLARFIPNPMDGLLVLAICWIGLWILIFLVRCWSMRRRRKGMNGR
jgi:hypothetical protein